MPHPRLILETTLPDIEEINKCCHVQPLSQGSGNEFRTVITLANPFRLSFMLLPSHADFAHIGFPFSLADLLGFELGEGGVRDTQVARKLVVQLFFGLAPDHNGDMGLRALVVARLVTGRLTVVQVEPLNF